MGGRTLTLGQVLGLTALTRAELDARITAGSFPAPLPLGPWTFGWSEAAVSDWLAAQRAAPGSDQAGA